MTTQNDRKDVTYVPPAEIDTPKTSLIDSPAEVRRTFPA